MPVSAPVLAGQTLASPKEYKKARTYRGGRQVMASGALVTDLVNTTAKHRWELGWGLLTDAQYTTLRTAFDAIKDASGSYTDIDGVVYTVTLDETFDELENEAVKMGGAGNVRWRVPALKLREV